jgi:hypothetical protein
MPTATATSRTRKRAPVSPWEQLPLELGAVVVQWRYSGPVRRSRHFGRIRERLEFVRGFFPELEGVCVRVGLARSRNVLGSCSLDPDDPAIWVRPKLVDAFTITHELTHLLQARGLMPGGERACDLHALSRSPLLIDSGPTYLKVPEGIRHARALDTPTRVLLHDVAVRALRRREAGHRNYLRYFELTFEREYEGGLRFTYGTETPIQPDHR